MDQKPESTVTTPNDKQDIEIHGGDLDRAADLYGNPPGGWVDLSTGINPCAYPATGVSDAAWARLPQAKALAELKSAAVAAYGAVSPDTVACAPGTQALIQILPRVLGAPRVTVLGPTYSEHAAVWRRSGAEVAEAGELPPPDRSLVVVNPNNPDGRAVAPDVLQSWAAEAAPAGHFLIVDEAFADVRPEISLVPAMPLANVVVLRSFGKFHGLAGLRLGVAVAASDLTARLEAEQGPWAVSGPALEIGARALADRDWAEKERARLSDRMARLRRLLSQAGLSDAGGTDLYMLTEHGHASDLYGHLASRGILVRRFADAPCRLRFGLPGPEDQWERLKNALTEFALPGAVPGRRHG